MSDSAVCKPLKLQLIIKTLLSVLILSRYWQIGIFTLVTDASCVPGGVLSILFVHFILSALNIFKTSCTVEGGKVRSKLMQKLPGWSGYLDSDSNGMRSAVDFPLPQGKQANLFFTCLLLVAKLFLLRRICYIVKKKQNCVSPYLSCSSKYCL